MWWSLVGMAGDISLRVEAWARVTTENNKMGLLIFFLVLPPVYRRGLEVSGHDATIILNWWTITLKRVNRKNIWQDLNDTRHFDKTLPRKAVSERTALLSPMHTLGKGSTFSSCVTWAVPTSALEMTNVHQPHQAGVSIPSLGRPWGWLSLL